MGLQRRRPGFDPWVGKIPWRRAWQPTPVSLPGEFHAQRSLVGYSPWGRKELNMTEWLTLSISTQLNSLFTIVRLLTRPRMFDRKEGNHPHFYCLCVNTNLKKYLYNSKKTKGPLHQMKAWYKYSFKLKDL